MAYRGPTFRPRNTQTDSPATNTCDIDDTGSSSTMTSGTMTGSTSAVTTFQIFPTSGSGTLGSASAANTSLANNKGWWIPPTTGMASTSTDQRTLPAGTVFSFKVIITATGLAGNDTATIRVYRRSAAGVLTSINSGGSGSAPNGVGGTTTTVTASTTLASEVVLAAGETLYFEMYIVVAQQSLSAGTAVAKLDSTCTWVINTPDGIDWRYSRSQAVTSTGSPTAKKAVTVGAKAVAGTGVVAASRAPLALLRPYLVAGTGVLAYVRSVGIPRAVTSSGSAVLQPRALTLASKVAAAVGSIQNVKRVVLTAKVAVGTGVVSATRASTLFRAFSVVSTGATAFARAVTVARRFSIIGTGSTKTRIDIPQEALNRISVSGPTDYPITSPTKSISGTAVDDTDNPLVGATAKLFRQSDDFMCQVTTTGAGGAYSFPRDASDPNTYYVLAYSLAPDGTTQIHGVSDRDLVPS